MYIDRLYLILKQRLNKAITAIFLATALMLGSCSQPARQQSEQPTSTAAPASTAAVQGSSTALPGTSPATPIHPLSTAEKPGQAQVCTSEEGTIKSFTLRDQALFRDMPVRIYLPPCYGEIPDRSYPTLYLLHGLQSTDDQWDKLGIDETADELISDGTLPPFLIVMPWHRTGIEIVSAVPEILVPYIESHYAVRRERPYRSIGGLSIGGGQALEIGLKFPQLFAAVGMHSPAVPYVDSIIIDWAGSIPAAARPLLWLDIGQTDSLYPAARSLVDALQSNSIPISLQINEGDHLPQYWSSHLEDYLRWYGTNWLRAAFIESE